MIKQIFELHLNERALAILIWITAIVTAVLTLVLAESNASRIGQILAALATVAFAFVGYSTLSDGPTRHPTRWQIVVWFFTFLITVFFLARAVTRATF